MSTRELQIGRPSIYEGPTVNVEVRSETSKPEVLAIGALARPGNRHRSQRQYLLPTPYIQYMHYNFNTDKP